MSGAGAWSLSLAGAGFLHMVAASALLVSVAPDERPPPEPRPESRLNLAVVAVPQGDAREVASEREPAPLTEPNAAAVVFGAMTASRAHSLAPTPEALEALPRSPALPAETPDAARVPSARPVIDAARPILPLSESATRVPPAPGPAVAPSGLASGIAAAVAPAVVNALALSSGGEPSFEAAKPEGTARPALAPRHQSSPALVSAGERADAAAPPATELSAGAPTVEVLRARVLEASLVPSAAPETPSLYPAVLPATAVPDAARPAEILPHLAPEAPPATEVSPATEAVTAAVAFSADFAATLPEGALDAVEAFLVPDPGAEGQALRDGIADQLGGVACARVQTAFDPETGVLELRGHVPDPEERSRLAVAIEAELGGALPVVDRLLELPRPQCEVLSGLTAAGIPQSTEQFTNPLIIGEDTHARVYAFRGGDTMRLDVGGADYDGWLYLDYYDSAGNVLHLVPNEAVPLVRLAARAAVRFGGGGAADVAAGRVRLEVGPPFGKDIAVALVTSAPLFGDLRPAREPVSDYLAALAQRVEDLRRRDPDFKAEWVYLFVSTAP